MKRWNRREFLKGLGLATASLSLSGCLGSLQGSGTTRRPNIVLIMSDDMGFSDIGCYGGEINTPTLDTLAAGGLRFTQFYNTARCCPTRAALMTGLYQHQAGVGHMMEDRGVPSYQGDLNRQCVTIAEVMKLAGYRTYMAGKWHLTPLRGENLSKHNWPCQRGYDRFFGTIHGAGSFYDPNTLTLDNKQIVPWDDFYYTEAISDYASRFIREHKEPDPFFMYVAYTAAHWPMHARKEDIAKYKGRYSKGWDALRAERYERLKKMELIDPKWELTPRDQQIPAWEKEPFKEWNQRRMEVYAAMVDNMDRGIKRIVETLRQKGELENTLIFFLQDNGGCAEEYGSNGPIKPDPSKPVELKPMAPDELQTGMQPTVTRDGRPVRTGKGVMPGPADTYIAYGKAWANASNTPFRLYKHWVHEGGISTPLIVHWPARIKDTGQLRSQPGHLIDIMATCVDVAAAEYPKEYKGNIIQPMEGRSLVPAFENRPIERPEGLFWEHEGNRAVRKGDWKLVSRYPGRWELYNLKEDRTEMHNLVEEHPKIVKELKNMYNAWAKRCNVVPWGELTKK
ncbi:MAG: sulfatase-like hydrolase/transferase [Sedimentisphaerales bacterium]|nr:sulfatase-like hydrolase/transferase [Sedimentisphaerales bacterium]